MTGMGGAFAISAPPGSATEHIPNEQHKKNNCIVFFANSFAATNGTNTRNATFKSVHSALLQW